MNSFKDPALRGHVNKRAGIAFEKALELQHHAYRQQGLAIIRKVPVPTRQVTGGYRVRIGKSPFDFSGWLATGSPYPGRAIAMEAKTSATQKNVLRVVQPDKRGEGLQYHQIEALAEAASDNAFPAVVWDNGGSLMVLWGDRLLSAWVSISQQKAKSIPASLFRSLSRNPGDADWLTPIL